MKKTLGTSATSFLNGPFSASFYFIFVLSNNFTVDVSEIRTRIVRVEDEHLTTTARPNSSCLSKVTDLLKHTEEFDGIRRPAFTYLPTYLPTYLGVGINYDNARYPPCI